MKKRSKKIISALTLISLSNLLTSNVFASEINTFIKEESITISRRYLDDIPKIGEKEYLDKYKVNVSKYENNGGEFGTNKLDQAFDNDWNTFWESNDRNDPNGTVFKNYITVTFDNTYDISRILYATKNHGTIGAGYPEKLKIMASETDSGDNFVEVATYISEKTKNKVIFELSKPVKAKRIKFVFEDVYDSWASASEIMFLKEDSLLNEVENMFANDEYNELKEKYMNDEIVEDLENQAQNHTLSDYLLSKINIAKKIVTGEIDKENSLVNSTDFPVHVIQKTGPDSEKRVLLFMAEGYTAGEQDKFINDLNKKVEQIRDTEPYRSYSNEFNIYAMKVVSNETGLSNSWESKDTYFKMYGNGRRVDFTGDGIDKALRLIKQFKDKYLDEGANVVNSNILVNSTMYGGLNTGQIAISTLNNDFALIHELSHSLGLDDEYYESGISTIERPNITTESDPSKVKWKEFLGFRDIDIVRMGSSSNGTVVYKPSHICIMGENVYRFCEVCKLHIATNINESIKNKRELYVADPITTIKLQDSGYKSGVEIQDSNITQANGNKLEFRTVVKNFTSEEKNLELQFAITDNAGQVKHQVSQDFVVKAGELKSLQVVTDKLNDLVSGDKISGKVIEKGKNVELANQDTYNKKFGTVNIKYKLATEKNETDIDMDLVAEQITKVEANTRYTLTPPTLKDYIYLRNNVNDSTVEIKEGEQREIIYYYAKKRGKVILELLDENGNKVRDKERYIKYKETFIPSKSDFPEKEGYELKLPNSVTYEGADYPIITYQYVKKEEIVEAPVINGINNIEIKAGQVDQFNETGKLEGITATDYKGNSLQVTVTGKVEKPKAGTNEAYELIYEATDNYGNTTKETRVITVTNQLPVISGLEKLVIKEGQNIDLLLGVTASDKEDGNITNILVDENVDINTAGLYEAIYKVTDSDGNTTTAVREIVVEENTEVIPPSNGSNASLPPAISDAINNNLLNITHGSGTIDDPVELEFNNISDDKVDILLSDLKGLNIKINSLEEKDGYTLLKFSILEEVSYKNFKTDNIKATNGEVHIVLKAKNEYQSIANKLKEFAGNAGNTGDTGNNGNDGNIGDTGNNDNAGNDGNTGDTDKKNESIISKPINNEAKLPQTGDMSGVFTLFIGAVVTAAGGAILKDKKKY